MKKKNELNAETRCKFGKKEGFYNVYTCVCNIQSICKVNIDMFDSLLDIRVIVIIIWY